GQWHDASYEAQATNKQAVLADHLRRGGGIIDPPLLEPVLSPQPFNYRNVGEFHVGRKAVGFNREGSHELVDVRGCPLMEEPIDAALQVVRAARDQLTGVSSVQIR